MIFCATLTAVAHDDWFRRRGWWYKVEAHINPGLRRAVLCCEQVERRDVEKVCWRAMLEASRDDRLVMPMTIAKLHYGSRQVRAIEDFASSSRAEAVTGRAGQPEVVSSHLGSFRIIMTR